jgi:hypothetical protein
MPLPAVIPTVSFGVRLTPSAMRLAPTRLSRCRPAQPPSARSPLICRSIALLALLAAAADAQEIRGFAKLDARGDAVWGANVTLMDSLGREAATARTNRHGEFTIQAPLPGTYFLQLSARTVGRTSSPVFVLDSGATLHYEHIFRRNLSELVRERDVTAQTLLQGPFRDSSAGKVYRGVSGQKVTQVRVTVLNAQSEAPIPDADVVLVAIDSRVEMVVGGKTDSSGGAGWRSVQPAWYRVIGRRLGLEPGGSLSFPIMGDADSVSVVLRLNSVTVLDPVTIMEQRITAFGFNLKLMSRYYLGGADLMDRNPSARNVDELITSLRIPGLSVKTGDIESQMTYRGQRVRVFILDGSRTNGDLPLVEPSAVESLMFIPPHEAGAIFGPDASGGVLIINTRNVRQR